MQLPSKSQAKNIGFVSLSSYCWRDDLVNRYESLWSLIHKFALLNAVNAATISKIFERESQKREDFSLKKWKNRNDLRYSGALDIEKLATILNLKKDRINESLVSSFIKPDEIATLSCETLRFCGSCLQSGFHSPLHQLLFITECPTHKELLITRCPNCENKISYRLDDNEAFKQPYCCSQCRIIFCQALSKTGGKLTLLKARDASLKLIGDWLLKRIENNTLELSLKSDDSDEIVTARKKKIISRLSLYWSNSLEVSNQLKPILEEQIIPNKSVHIAMKINDFVDDDNRADLFGNEWDKDLCGIYKSIGRHIKQKVFFEHLDCINSVGRNTWWGQYVSSCSGRICAYSNAFLLWRMYFEGVDHPTKFFRKYKGNTINRNRIYWQPPTYNYSESILKRLFAFECYWIFGECLMIAKKSYSENTYSFNSFDVKNQHIPYWLFAPNLREKTKKQFFFHYWLENSELDENLTFYNLKLMANELQISTLCPILGVE